MGVGGWGVVVMGIRFGCFFEGSGINPFLVGSECSIESGFN